MKTNDFINKWDDLRSQKGYMQRVDPSHPLDFFIGISEKGYDQLALITYAEPAQMKSSKALDVEKNKRKDGKWATQISSVDNSNQDIFARLCIDLVETSYNVKTEIDGISRVTARFLAWQRLFAIKHETLPKSVLKGLVGELAFAMHLMDEGVSKDDVLNAWGGPDGADRDFTFKDTWYEVKAISTGKDKVTISSLNQLETSLDGYLIATNVDETAKLEANANSVSHVINQFRNILSDAPEASRLFEEKLVSLGYLDKDIYDEIFFKVGETQYFKVNQTFPRLITDSVPIEIVKATYDLSIAGIQKWKVGAADIWN